MKTKSINVNMVVSTDTCRKLVKEAELKGREDAIKEVLKLLSKWKHRRNEFGKDWILLEEIKAKLEKIKKWKK